MNMLSTKQKRRISGAQRKCQTTIALLMFRFPEWRDVLDTSDVDQVRYPREFGVFSIGRYKVHVDDYDEQEGSMFFYLSDVHHGDDVLIAEATMFSGNEEAQIEFTPGIGYDNVQEIDADLMRVLNFMAFFHTHFNTTTKKRVRFS